MGAQVDWCDMFFILQALASTLDEDELSDLRDQFDAIDVDKNGVISLEEMRQAMEKDLPWRMKDSRVVEILQAVCIYNIMSMQYVWVAVVLICDEW